MKRGVLGRRDRGAFRPGRLKLGRAREFGRGRGRGRGLILGCDALRACIPLLALLWVATGCTAPEGMRPLAVGDDAPAYTARAVTGDSITIRDHGGAVLLNVWATWCVPCREEMPALDSLHRAYRGQGLRVVGANIDNGDATNAVRNFANDHNLSFDLLLDPQQRVVRTFRTAGVPESFLIDRNGKIAARWIGQFDPLAEQVVAVVEAALGIGEN